MEDTDMCERHMVYSNLQPRTIIMKRAVSDKTLLYHKVETKQKFVSNDKDLDSYKKSENIFK